MYKKLTHWRTLIFLAVAFGLVAVGIVTFVCRSNTTDASVTDWPPLTMTYQTDFVINGATYDETRMLTYKSRNSWEEKVIAADPFELREGVFSTVGSYRKLENDQFTTHDQLGGSPSVEEVGEGVLTISRDYLYANPIEPLEEFLDIKLTPVTTKTRVCFEDACTEDAPGWEFRYKDVVVVYADDARGNPHSCERRRQLLRGHRAEGAGRKEIRAVGSLEWSQPKTHSGPLFFEAAAPFLSIVRHFPTPFRQRQPP